MASASLTFYSYEIEYSSNILMIESYVKRLFHLLYYFNKIESQEDMWNWSPEILLNIDFTQILSSDVSSIFWGWMRLREVEWLSQVHTLSQG